jgi:hypothetical protein
MLKLFSNVLLFSSMITVDIILVGLGANTLINDPIFRNIVTFVFGAFNAYYLYSAILKPTKIIYRFIA